MIFRFLTSSIAPLKAELAPVEDQSKIIKNCSLGLKTGVLNGFQNCFSWSNSTFLRCKGHNWNITIEKINFHFQI